METLTRLVTVVHRAPAHASVSGPDMIYPLGASCMLVGSYLHL